MRNEKLFVILWQNYNIMEIYQYTTEAVELLKRVIATPSISREESTAADILADFIEKYGLPAKRIGNNILVCETLDPEKPTLLLNAHIDTVKPVSTWTRDPFSPTVEGDRLYGLGANDCGGGLVSLLQVYRLLRGKTTPYNLVYLASCEEEVSGAGGFSLALPELPKIDVAIVGEPTGMHPAIAEKGLMVIDGVAYGKSGHAAREEGVNAIYEALKTEFAGKKPILVTTMDARRHQVYAAAFDMDLTVLIAPEAMPPDELAKKLDKMERPCLFLGDASAIYQDVFQETLGSKAFLAPEEIRGLRAGTSCRLAEKKIREAEEKGSLLPCVHGWEMRIEYLRKPQAEREREERLRRAAAEGERP